jgi:hypothetical protein
MATMTEWLGSNGEKFFGSFVRAESASSTRQVVPKARFKHAKNCFLTNN